MLVDKYLLPILLIGLSLPATTLTSRICIFSVVGFLNYRSGYDTLIESLIDKGHEITVFSNIPMRVGQQYKTKLHLINPKAVNAHLDTFFTHISPLEWRQEGKHHVLWDILPIVTLDVCHIILQHQETQQWLHSAKHYDLFIVDSSWNECGIVLAHAFQSKFILFSFHSNLFPWNLDAFGAVSEVAWIPDVQYESTSPISFFQKLHFTIRSFRWHMYRNLFTFYQIRKFSMQFLQRKNIPNIRDLEQNASLVLVNSHFSEEYSRSLPPLFVPVGGVHIRTEESTAFKRNQQSSLVKKVETFVGNASGFILVNIGCSKDTRTKLPHDTLLVILNAMQKANQIVKFVFIWGEGKSNLLQSQTAAFRDTVLIVEECSQELHTLLAHPQIKGLISHGDLLDVQEAIYHSVPLILLPVAFEQDANAERIERLGRGIRLEIVSLKEDDLTDAVKLIVTNSTYKNNMHAASQSFRDRPVPPLESALWWIEYIIRNSDTSSLKPLGIHQTWYSRRLLDVWLFLFSCTVGALVVVLSSFILKAYFSKNLLVQCKCAGGVNPKPVSKSDGLNNKQKFKKILPKEKQFK